MFGAPVPSGLVQSAWLGAALFVLAMGVGGVLITADRPLRGVGDDDRARPEPDAQGRPLKTGTPEKLVRERNAIRETLGSRWWDALTTARGNWLFDYLALLAALTAVGAKPRPTLVLLAYVASAVLGMIPITPGGLGFVEAGLTATLTLAGVSAADAVLATLAYRLVSYWLPLPWARSPTWRTGTGTCAERRRASRTRSSRDPAGTPRAHGGRRRSPRPTPHARA